MLTLFGFQDIRYSIADNPKRSKKDKHKEKNIVDLKDNLNPYYNGYSNSACECRG
jgi:hypothetical protein